MYDCEARHRPRLVMADPLLVDLNSSANTEVSSSNYLQLDNLPLPTKNSDDEETIEQQGSVTDSNCNQKLEEAKQMKDSGLDKDLSVIKQASRKRKTKESQSDLICLEMNIDSTSNERKHLLDLNIKSDPEYKEKRRKNNESAKRSRDARRMKEEQIAMKVIYLEQENVQLRAEATLLIHEIEKLKYLLYNS